MNNKKGFIHRFQNVIKKFKKIFTKKFLIYLAIIVILAITSSFIITTKPPHGQITLIPALELHGRGTGIVRGAIELFYTGVMNFSWASSLGYTSLGKTTAFIFYFLLLATLSYHLSRKLLKKGTMLTSILCFILLNFLLSFLITFLSVFSGVVN